MARAYSRDLRARSVQAVDAGEAPSGVARLLRISERTLRRWRRQKATTGDLAPRPHPGRRPKLSPAQQAALGAHVRAHPDAALAERGGWIERSFGVRVSPATVSRLLAKLDCSFKKRV
jgi:transposase